ncbi:hypothetical protein CLAFUW4_07087 [Fulvia fulva]|uniref:Uncharacterized protein n=1 Tax=Passalora fulva TaxID=5499 RepID=A0A9Q8PB40_PASFU|nr:uncharacterized protein CLAFUR5_07223 [Fulvia fulva]KAK4621335.1 hypothetical protein CLAFUR4_07096 [Fulvia fulva]KAK4622936.1 hypothetical protein CLAFUR0_07094 [Fulvia fulva]UJO19207.1 hypothetical protein CLAFUR5_07223 [Fulvia fulva]WPV16594.1 hypothetical protein CLAFUW4_07087 [Fulvia fulva]WPV30896.1 hypothetical protein CLAFUW7_07087 [Fulvia fulva]
MLSMTNNDISSARDLTLEDDGIEVVESSTATTATVKQETTPAAEHQPSPTNSDSSGKPDTATQLLQYIGHYAGKKLRNSLARAPTGTHLKELTKLADYPYGEGTNMPRADAKTKAMADPLPSHHFRPDYFRQESEEEKVLRVWIPLDPNENPNPNLRQTQIPSVNHWSRPSIISLINTEISLTRQVFDIMQAQPDRYPTVSKLHAASILSSIMGDSSDPMKDLRASHAILGLRLKGVEVCEWVEDFERVEVHWEDLAGKMGFPEVEDMKRYFEGLERDRKLYVTG